jgi:hypothetical protein
MSQAIAPPTRPPTSSPILFLSQCPSCRGPIPPMHGGIVRIRERGSRITVMRAFWCHYDEVWWIVDTTAARRGQGGVRQTRPRRATAIEAAMAERKVFAERGVGAPVD